MDSRGIGWTRLTQDQAVAHGPCLLYGLVLLTSVTGGDVTVYDGVDSGAGRRILRAEGTADESRPVLFPVPLHCDGGIYVDVGTSVTEVLILWQPLPAEAQTDAD